MENANESGELIKVYETSNQGELAFIKSLLGCNNIPFFAHGENINSMYSGAFWFEPVRILVPKENLEAAREIIEQFKKDGSG
ncbi:MAG: DUF2007 domain-containing protein [Elusimicrobiota bacterium]